MFFHESLSYWYNASDISRLFSDEQLYVLGVTREYMDFFQEKRSKMREEKLKLIKENIKDYSEKRRNQIAFLSIEEHDMYCELFYIYKFSLHQLQKPEESRKPAIYSWMGFREDLFDTSELQKFKIFPQLHYQDEDILTPQLRVKKYIDNKDWNILAYCREMGVEYPQF